MLQVKNVSKSKTLIDGGRVADNSWTRLKGLIGVKEMQDGEGLLIKPCKGVHCMFMSIPIDVLYLDSNDCILDVDENMQPNSFGQIKKGCKYVIELPAGAVKRTGTSAGDQLEVVY